MKKFVFSFLFFITLSLYEGGVMLSQVCSNTPTWTGAGPIGIGINPPNKLLHLGSGELNAYSGCYDPTLEFSYFSATGNTNPGNYCGYLSLKTPTNFEQGAIPYSFLANPGDLVLEAGGLTMPPMVTSSNLILTNRNGNANSNIIFGITPAIGTADFEAMTIMNSTVNSGQASVGINNTSPKNDLTIGSILNFAGGTLLMPFLGFNQYYGNGNKRIITGKASQLAFSQINGRIYISSTINDAANSLIDYTEANSGYRGIIIGPFTNSTNLGIGTNPVSDCRTLIQGFGNDNSASALSIINSDQNSLFYVRNDGNIGIGTASPDRKLTVIGDVQIGTTYYTQSLPSWLDYRLSVDGQITCKEIIVELDNWADDVFHKNYKLMPINQLEQSIQKYGHLPEIPSESEVKENGVNLVEMQSKLLRKIEELTLYVIDLKKENESLKTKVSNIESQIK